ncbi:hypothetical protein [Rheinheimera tilapiae]|uniref:Uncharacterized protein n=1 Tax=Rheinheimera tilapiae TaxID=875043 RepID=A0ABV6BCG7_9GAMM
MKYIILAIFLTISASCLSHGNIHPFVSGPKTSHPICGINLEIVDQSPFISHLPFASCNSLAISFHADERYNDPGLNELSKLLIILFEGKNHERHFEPLSNSVLKCIIKPPIIERNTHANPDVPYCTKEMVKDYLLKYNRHPAVEGFRRFENSVSKLDLSDKIIIDKIRKTTAIARVSGSSLMLSDISELLE